MRRAAEEDRARRSRLSPQREAEVYSTIVDLLREVGYDAMSMQMVATAAHCSKATLYRWWHGKPGMVVAALRHLQNQIGMTTAIAIDTGSLAGDLREFARGLGSTSPADRELLATMVGAGRRIPELQQAMQETLAPSALLTPVLQRAAERGEIAPEDPAAAFAEQMLLGVALARPVVNGIEPDVDYLVTFVDEVLLPLLTGARSTRTPAGGRGARKSAARGRAR
ncbi:TetR/AcrR family transcriptional regulator [Nocardia miyunensis]|uniref:TetR/AcrR family transcriptional regulator n=1 Tax=Nocardia miyunensis TaxID=282684 RepID=UPI0008313212|nr:TetR/AcrR family transcriptional regulator [Nocardia miyunensis]